MAGLGNDLEKPEANGAHRRDEDEEAARGDGMTHEDDTRGAASLTSLEVAVADIESSPMADVQLPDDNGESDGRETWGKKLDFLLSVIGFAVDLANVWRFPYLCYKNGGGAFLIPYLLMLVFGGIPLFYMELALGQYVRKGAITCWGRICPLFKGIGYTVVMIAFYTDFFYNVIIAWSLYYFYKSFAINLPWTTCNNTWNTPTCSDEHLQLGDSDEYRLNLTTTLAGLRTDNGSGGYLSGANDSSLIVETLMTANITSNVSAKVTTYPAAEFYEFAVLGQVEGTNLENIGDIQWHLAICLIVVYCICYFSLWKGISTSGKVVWFTAVFPYVVLVILLIRGISLEGSMNGIHFYIVPNITKLKKAEPWIDAATQVYFSLGPGFGVLLAFASYNKFHNNVFRDVIITSAVNSFTSFLSGFVVFSVLGYMASKRGVDVVDVVAEDPGLVFTVYPEALATLPWSTFWSLMFFLMLLTLGLDSSFGGSEAIITALSDEFSIVKRKRPLFLFILFLVYYCIGLVEITQGGLYIIHLFERYCVSYSILLAVLFETLCVSWIYGVDRFRGNIKEMVGFLPGLYWKICWKYIAPIFIICNIIFGVTSHKNLKMGTYEFPMWSNVVGWCLAASSIMFIPFIGVIEFIKAPGTAKERFAYIIQPWEDTHRSRKYKDENAPMHEFEIILPEKCSDIKDDCI